MKRKSYMNVTWVLMIIFFVLSIVNIYFGLLGFICMFMPLILVFKGEGKIHCSKYCPRGSFLGKIIDKISIGNTKPKFMNSIYFKEGLLVFMFTSFGISLYFTDFEPEKVAFAVFRLLFSSSILAVLMGIVYKPRTWCQVCPMGNLTGKIHKKRKG
ncbi:MAG: 4Fe-4S ferredoxin [Clostridia bacterium]|jgi:hypothetical protein|nr:4Fe-4S ferredoxin [Clostridia bacterium]